LRPNLVILDADKRPVTSPAELKKILGSKSAGDSVLLRVRLDKETVSFIAVQLPK
jgi:S1-C subfamily serine protease